MQVKVYVATHSTENSVELTYAKTVDMITYKFTKSLRPLNGAESVLADGYVVGTGLSNGDIVEIDSKKYEVIDTTSSLIGICKYYIKSFGG